MNHQRNLARMFLTAALILSVTPSVIGAMPAYTMTICDGFVAVWSHSTNDWYIQTRIPVNHLQKSDQFLLERGLSLMNDDDLIHAMEDFCS